MRATPDTDLTRRATRPTDNVSPHHHVAADDSAADLVGVDVAMSVREISASAVDMASRSCAP
jgi:hypothetical protein